ncbi:hypothetical protein IT575_13690 [bacterium]|nr:hypothetical protein [bacterium]
MKRIQISMLSLGLALAAGGPAFAISDPRSGGEEIAAELRTTAADCLLQAQSAGLDAELTSLSAEAQSVEFRMDTLDAALMAQRAQLDCLGEELARGCAEGESPFSGQITYRMQFAGSGLADLGNFQQGVRFDLSYREWVSDSLLLNLQIGSRDSSVFDVISGRHGSDAQLEQAYIEGHFGEMD